MIPKGLMSFKMDSGGVDSMGNHASRMVFEQEDKIRIINGFGLDSVLQLNIDESGNIKDKNLPLIIRSVCKIDHFNSEPGVDKHMIKD